MKYFTHWMTAFITLFIMTYIGLQDPWVKEVLRLKSFDILLANEDKSLSQDITIITIDEAAIEKYGQWPWPRDKIADLIINLRQAETGIIVMPILFSEEDRFGHDDYFCETLTYGTVIAQTGTVQTRTSNPVPRGVAKIGDPLAFLYEWPGMVGPLPKLADCTNGVGVINTAPEVDGVVRRVPLLMKIGEEVYPNMSIETIRVAVGDPSYQVKADKFGVTAMRVPGYDTINTDANARIWLRWNKEFKTISAASDDFSEAAGTTIIIALTAEGLSSIVATPIGEQYDYVISANSLQTILDGETVKRFDSLIELIVAFTLGFAMIIVVRYFGYGIIAAVIFFVSVGLPVYADLFFKQGLVLVDFTWVLLTFLLVAFHSTFLRFILEFKLKQQIRKQFEKYLDPRQVAILVKNPEKLKLGGERKEMSFLFMDIVGFTPISEYYKNNDDPEGLVEVINDYLNRMSKIVLKNGGTIDKYMGDCIMAFWNAPLDEEKHAEKAVQAALEMRRGLQELNNVLQRERGFEINTGIGINTGPCIVGNMGSSSRFDYSVIGDAVNLAARLESSSKTLGKTVVVGEKTYKAAKYDYNFDYIDSIMVKGKTESVKVYTIKN